MKTIVLSLLCIALNFSAVFSQNSEGGIQFFKGTFKEALASAQQNNKLLFVDCFTTWCGPCKWMEKNVFPTSEAGDYFNEHFVSYQLDMEKGEGPEIAKKYGVKMYPTYLFLDSKGNVLHRKTSSMPVEDFIEVGKVAVDPSKRLASYTNQYNSGDRSPEFVMDYAYRLKKGGDLTTASKVADDYLAGLSNEALLVKDNWEFVVTFVTDLNSREFKYVIANTAKFEALYTTKVNKFILGIASQNATTAGKNKDEALLNEVIKLYKAYAKRPDFSISGAYLEYYRRTGDWDKYAATAVAYMNNEYYKMDYTQAEIDERSAAMGKDFGLMIKQREAATINGIAWNFYEQINDVDLLKKAVKWIAMAAELDASYGILDTYAAVLFKSGNIANGKLIAQKAIDAAKKSGDDYSGTEALIEKYAGK